MCAKNSQYTMMLCRKPILGIIKNILDRKVMSEVEPALILLRYIINEYVGPIKAFVRGDQYEDEIRRVLCGNDFLLRLLRIITDPTSRYSTLKPAFCCLSEYTKEIYISLENRKKLLLSVNEILNVTVISNQLK